MPAAYALYAVIAITLIVVGAILAVAGLGLSAQFATVLSALAVGLVTAVCRFWPAPKE